MVAHRPGADVNTASAAEEGAGNHQKVLPAFYQDAEAQGRAR